MATERNQQGDLRNRANKSPNDAPRVVYTPNPGTTPEAEAQVLAAVYKVILESAERTKTAAAEADKEAGRE